MNAADTSASRAIADWTPLTVASRSSTTDEIDTFISDVSTTSTNIAIDSRMGRRLLRVSAGGAAAEVSVMQTHHHTRAKPHGACDLESAARMQAAMRSGHD